MATRHDFVIDRTSRKVIVFDVTVGWLSSLAGYTAQGTVVESQTLDGPVLLSLTPFLTVDVAQSYVILDLPADTIIDWDQGHYDIKLVDGNPDHDVRIVQGHIDIDMEA